MRCPFFRAPPPLAVEHLVPVPKTVTQEVPIEKIYERVIQVPTDKVVQVPIGQGPPA